MTSMFGRCAGASAARSSPPKPVITNAAKRRCFMDETTVLWRALEQPRSRRQLFRFSADIGIGFRGLPHEVNKITIRTTILVPAGRARVRSQTCVIRCRALGDLHDVVEALAGADVGVGNALTTPKWLKNVVANLPTSRSVLVCVLDTLTVPPIDHAGLRFRKPPRNRRRGRPEKERPSWTRRSSV